MAQWYHRNAVGVLHVSKDSFVVALLAGGMDDGFTTPIGAIGHQQRASKHIVVQVLPRLCLLRESEGWRHLSLFNVDCEEFCHMLTSQRPLHSLSHFRHRERLGVAQPLTLPLQHPLEMARLLLRPLAIAAQPGSCLACMRAE